MNKVIMSLAALCILLGGCGCQRPIVYSTPIPVTVPVPVMTVPGGPLISYRVQCFINGQLVASGNIINGGYFLDVMSNRYLPITQNCVVR